MTDKLPQIVPNSPAQTQTTIPETTESNSGDLKPRPLSKPHRARSPLAKLPDADLVLAYVLGAHTRTTLAKIVTEKKRRPLWNLLIECIKSGAFGEPRAVSNERPNLRVLFPWMQPWDRWVSSFDLSKPSDVALVKEFVLPAVLAVTDRSPLAINEIRREVGRRRQEKDDQQRRLDAHERHQQKLATSPLPLDEEEVIAYGKPLWPSERGYSYTELVHACWFADFMFDILRAETATARSMNLLHALKFLEPPMISAGTLLAIRDIAAAYVEAPQQGSKWPPKPARFFLSA